jgi:F420-dependent hydroxymycolic acid dehydrogenase
MTRIGFVLSSEQFPVADLVEFAQRAEDAGFDAVWTSDHFQPWQANEGHSSQAWVTLAAVGARTSRVLLGTGVTCPSYRYRPAIVAQAFATLGQLYPGRVFLGVGAGEALNEAAAGGGWGPYKERIERLVDAISIIRGLWSQEQFEYRSRYYEIESARLYDVAPKPVPIYVAAGGKQSMRIAGLHGDGLITDAKSAIQPEMRDAFWRGANESGRSAERMQVIAEHFAVVGDTAEARRGAELWRFIPKSWERYVTDPDPRSIERRAQEEVPIEDVYKDWAIGRDPELHAQRLLKLAEGGVSQIFVHSPQQDQRGVIDFYGREVLPKVKKAQSAAPA